MKPSECLRLARDLIATPACWSQHATAQDKSGRYCSPLDAEAVRFDVMGALRRVEAGAAIMGAIFFLRLAVGGWRAPLAEWEADPKTTHDNVLHALRYAAELAEEAGR